MTISGPPAVLTSLSTYGVFAGINAKNIPIYAPYHAPQLFSEADVESILATTSAETWASYVQNLPIVSSTTGKLVEAGDFRSALKAALVQILIEPIRWSQLSQGVASVLQAFARPQFTVIPIGTSAEQTLYSALKQLEQFSADPANNLAHISLGLPVLSPKKEDGSSINDQEGLGGRPENSKIAIIGMSGRFPDAQDNEAFWDLLYQGLDVHKEVPTFHHWDAKTHVDLTGKTKNTSATPYGCWLDNPAAFDARFFNMSPREAPQVDPAQRIALMTAYEAIEQAGIVPDATPSTQKERVGVFYGVTSNDWMETNSAQNIDTYFIPGGNRAFIPGRINVRDEVIVSFKLMLTFQSISSSSADPAIVSIRHVLQVLQPFTWLVTLCGEVTLILLLLVAPTS